MCALKLQILSKICKKAHSIVKMNSPTDQLIALAYTLKLFVHVGHCDMDMVWAKCVSHHLFSS